MKRAPGSATKLSPEQIRDIETSAFALVEQNLEPRFYLLDVCMEKEAGYWYLRIYLDGQDFAVSLIDCEAVSRKLDPLMDTFKPLQDFAYSLEVSSPGLFRPLRNPREYQFYAGRPVRVEEKAPAQSSQKAPKGTALKAIGKAQEGILQAFDATRNTVTLKKQDSDETFEVPLDEHLAVCLNPVIQLPSEDEAELASQQDLQPDN